MVIYNRRKRREFYAKQQEASSTVSSNTAPPEQIALLEHDHEHQERQIKPKESIISRTKALLFDGLKKDEGGDDIQPEKDQEQSENGSGNMKDTYETKAHESSIMKTIEAK